MDLITIGETMVCFSSRQMGQLEAFPDLSKSIGGAETNTAIGLARLGKEVGWISKLGDDPFGNQILKTVRGEGVDVSQVQLSTESPTGIMFKEILSKEQVHVYYYRRNSAASTLTIKEIPFQYIKKAKRIHLTGITPALGETSLKTVLEVMKFCKQEGIVISFDINMRLKLWSEVDARLAFTKLYQYIDILFLSEDEAKICANSRDISASITALKKKLPEKTMLVVKKGERGASALCGNKTYNSKALKNVFVVDTVGAGDAFNAGFLYGQMEGLSIEESLTIGNWCGASVVAQLGDYHGAPSIKELNAYQNNDKTIER
ncbi:sugar kinase [Anaerobacillus sp. CMMVII]|uniref:sugar kinase n=1 Tax=Anaerobacillus sp. CMMVII TaxID=2755588 RepID=UPI0021B6F0C6|nr:sugar kinase [Anaerobacillus sp. CMMVII]MCT8139260.1 sugar kinase [Anaerobacillus sp. CMMVII]